HALPIWRIGTGVSAPAAPVLGASAAISSRVLACARTPVTGVAKVPNPSATGLKREKQPALGSGGEPLEARVQGLLRHRPVPAREQLHRALQEGHGCRFARAALGRGDLSGALGDDLLLRLLRDPAGIEHPRVPPVARVVV